jgi:dipeptidyl aminopeptidase/acylaminoacyl peptidase
VTRADPRPRQPAPAPAGGRRLPFSPAPALSLAGLVIVAAVTFTLLGGTLPSIPGPGNGNGGPIRTATPSNVVIVDPRADVPGSLLYVKDGNVWIQSGAEARQLTTSGRDSMPAWSPDGESVYLVRTTAETGRWPSGGIVRTYNLDVPRLVRINADGTEPEILLTGRLRDGGLMWSYFIREPAVSPDGRRIALITDGPDPTTGNPVVKLLNLETRALSNPRLPESQGLGHASPAWSPDGRFLLFVRNAREGARGTPQILRYNPATDRSPAMTTAGYATPSWSRDGRYVAATKTSSFGTDVVILDARNGTELLRVTDDESSFSPVWSPRGDAIAFFRLQHGVVDLVLVPLTSTAPGWTAGEPIALTINAGLDGASRPQWFIPADQLPPLPTPTPGHSPAASGPGSSPSP